MMRIDHSSHYFDVKEIGALMRLKSNHIMLSVLFFYFELICCFMNHIFDTINQWISTDHSFDTHPSLSLGGHYIILFI